MSELKSTGTLTNSRITEGNTFKDGPSLLASLTEKLGHSISNFHTMNEAVANCVSSIKNYPPPNETKGKSESDNHTPDFVSTINVLIMKLDREVQLLQITLEHLKTIA